MLHIDNKTNKSFLLCSPYAYNFGLGKRADADDIQNYDDEPEFYSDTNNFDKAGPTMENWENGLYMPNRNDIDVADYESVGYPRGEKRESSCVFTNVANLIFFCASRKQTFTKTLQFRLREETRLRLRPGKAWRRQQKTSEQI